MKAQLLRSSAFGALAIIVLAMFTIQANSQGRAENSLIGAWEQEITFRDCTTGAALRTRPGLISFMFGGVMQEFGTGQLIPQNRTDAQGSYSHDVAQSYSAVSKAFRFNADGSLAGTAKLYRQITLNDDRQSFNALVNSEIYDVNGVLVALGCATEIGTRLR